MRALPAPVQKSAHPQPEPAPVDGQAMVRAACRFVFSFENKLKIPTK